MLLALLVVEAGIEGSELLLAVVGTVVLASTVIHGASATPIAAWYGRRSGSVHEEERESDAAAVFGTHGDAATPISVQDLHERMESGESLYVLDVRARASYEGDPEQIPGDIRVFPDQIADWAIGETPDRPIVLYCA